MFPADSAVAPDGGRWDELRTPRLLLRHWLASDLEPFAALNADPRVMEHFPATMGRSASDALADRAQRHLVLHGWGLWAVELLATGEFIGFTGLATVPDDLPPAPGLEVGWRLAARHWGHGYAPEAGRAALEVAFAGLHRREVVSFTSEGNDRSRRVMAKIGLVHDPARTFEHPRTPGWAGRRHVVYALTASGFVP